jgi:K+-dependent Na+/Ca+ exchanger-like protein
MYLGGVTMIDFAVLIGSTVLLWCFSATKLRLDRWEGVTLLIVFAGYMSWLIYSA